MHGTYIKIRATVFDKSAVKPSECGSVAKKIKKKGKILNQGLHQRNRISALRHSQKQGLAEALTNTFGLGF